MWAFGNFNGNNYVYYLILTSGLSSILIKYQELMQIQMFISCCIVGLGLLKKKKKKKKKGYKIRVEW